LLHLLIELCIDHNDIVSELHLHLLDLVLEFHLDPGDLFNGILPVLFVLPIFLGNVLLVLVAPTVLELVVDLFESVNFLIEFLHHCQLLADHRLPLLVLALDVLPTFHPRGVRIH
jgi:hypothetical protein